MSFHSPHLLWLLVPLALLAGWEFARRRVLAVATWPKIARAWAGSFSVSLAESAQASPSRARIWLWLGLALCVAALARPRWGVIEEKAFDQSREVLIAVDLSKSMLAQDVKPSRLDRAKLLITSLLDRLKGERVGLVLFAGTSFLQSPLSSDYEILREFLPSLQPDYLPEGGSNYRAMLETSIQAFGTSTADRYLIVLSDGESTEEGWKEMSEQLKTKGIRVIGLGIGTTQGAFIPEAGGSFVKDERGAVVMSRLKSATLQELAQVTGGAYTDASAWVDLPGLLRRTVESGRKGEFTEKNTARHVERYQWFLAPGLLLLLISFWSEFPVRPRERALPIRGKGPAPARDAKAPQSAAAGLALALLLLGSSTTEAAENPAETLSAPLTTTVGRLAAKDVLSPKDYAELAQTTVTYGQRLKGAQQETPEGVVRDALTAVDAGEKLDAKAADWPRLRAELEELLRKPEQPPEQDKNQEQQQDKNQQQKQQNQQNQDQQKNDQNEKSDQQQQEQDQQQKQQQKDNEAFGDMKEQPEQPRKEEPEEREAPPRPQTQKVGGQQEKKADQQVAPELAMPLQKLDQIRNQDSPAKLHQLMQGQQQKQSNKGKDW
jgi:Ca-activated chloride channel homolog